MRFSGRRIRGGEKVGSSKNYWKAIFTDLHFWIPAIVLIGGLLVLHWIQ